MEAPSSNLTESVRTIIDWSGEGPGQHNFLILRTDQPEDDLIELLKTAGYTIEVFDQAPNWARFELLLIHAQSYMDNGTTMQPGQGLPQGKVALILSDFAFKEMCSNPGRHALWRTSVKYGTLLN